MWLSPSHSRLLRRNLRRPSPPHKPQGYIRTCLLPAARRVVLTARHRVWLAGAKVHVNRDALMMGARDSGDMTISPDKPAVAPRKGQALPIRVRNGAAMLLTAASGATDAMWYLALGNVFTSAMTGNAALLGIALAHRAGERIGRVLVSLIGYMAGAAIGARIARTPQPGDPVWPPAITRALAVEAVFSVAYAATRWAVGARSNIFAEAALLGLGAIALGIQSSAMQRFGDGLGLNREVDSQIVLSFGIPFALIPLLLITRARDTMTDMANRRLTSALMLLVTVVITTLNLYLLCDAVTGLV
jgi:hypothetical protein